MYCYTIEPVRSKSKKIEQIASRQTDLVQICTIILNAINIHTKHTKTTDKKEIKKP